MRRIQAQFYLFFRLIKTLTKRHTSDYTFNSFSCPLKLNKKYFIKLTYIPFHDHKTMKGINDTKRLGMGAGAFSIYIVQW